MSLATQLVLGQSLPGNTFLHRLNPILKILLLLIHCFLIFYLKNSYQLLAIIGLEIILILSLPVTIAFLIRGYLPFLILLSFTFFLNWLSFTAEVPDSSQIQFSFYGISGTKEGFSRGIFYFLRVLAILLSSSMLTLSTATTEITYALDKLLKPFKKIGFPSEEFALMLSISLRFIPILFEELQKLMRAQSLRGASFKSGNLKQRLIALQSLFIPLLESTMLRADNLAIAMEVRGFDAKKPRSSIQEYKLKALDIIAFSFYTLGFLLVLTF